ncbi:Virulence regulon transcriptional activator VirF [Rhodobacteraceae bacterium THAF1]|nr:Virulence regulon transcriptional activator VirF [Palleronia sp. THAF1]VDC30731.1 Virulence regulon transcriptional activator VirF [Rhodobacteraceae bacterium THAF1]
MRIPSPVDDSGLTMTYPGFVFRTLLEGGYPADTLLAGTGLDSLQLQDPQFRSGFPPLRQLLLNAIAATGDPHLGVTLAQSFRPTYIGLPAYAAMNAARFKAGLEVLERYFALSFPAIDLRLLDRLPGGMAAIRVRSRFPFDDLEYFGIGSAVVAIDGLLKAMLGEETVTDNVEMAFAQPDGWFDIVPRIAFPVRFGTERTRVVFHAELLDRPLPGSDPLNHARLTALCAQAMAEMAQAASPVGQVEAILTKADPLCPSLSQIAAKLGYSERSLRRHLQQSDTTFRAMLDEIRERRARALLSETSMPVKGVAATLGFESPSNFARSFKRWTGLTPNAFRERVDLGRN